MSRFLHDLARFACDTTSNLIPADVRDRAAIVLADRVGCMIVGSGAPEVRALIAYCENTRPQALATVAGTTKQLAPADAAWVGGAAGTWHDLDEGRARRGASTSRTSSTFRPT